jgi:chromosomal replication initiation ATPase DnaA
MTLHIVPTDVNELWSLVLKHIQNQISRPSFETWFQPTQAELHKDRLTIICPNEFSADWLNNRYERLILETIRMITNETPTGVEYVVDKSNDNSKLDQGIENLQDKMVFRNTPPPGDLVVLEGSLMNCDTR